MSKLKVTAIIELDQMPASKDGEIKSLKTAIKQAVELDQVPNFSKNFISTGFTLALKHAIRIEMWSKQNTDRSIFFQQCKVFIRFLQQKIDEASTVSMIQD